MKKLDPKRIAGTRYYAMRHLPERTHAQLETLAFKMRTTKETVVKQCLEIGLSFLGEAAGAAEAEAQEE